jgi:RNA polymerase sigma-19 factor, ECF subfamily
VRDAGVLRGLSKWTVAAPPLALGTFDESASGPPTTPKTHPQCCGTDLSMTLVQMHHSPQGSALDGRQPARTSRRSSPPNALLNSMAEIARKVGQRKGLARADTEDLVQRVLLTCLGNLERISEGSERGFATAVASREVQHLKRAYCRRREVGWDEAAPPSTGKPGLDEQVHRRRTLQRASAVLAELDEAARSAWLWHELDGMSCAQIAAQSGLAVGTVKSQLRRARCQLSQRLPQSA